VLAMEEISKACASTGVIMSVNNSLVCWPLETYGTEEQKQTWLAPLARGEKLGAYCLSEPNAGTDAANQQTFAKPDGDGWVINGMKNFITNGAHADTLIVFAQTNPALRHKGIRAFIVEKTDPGFSVIRKEDKMGIRASETSQLALDGVKVGPERVLGDEGTGFRIAMSTWTAAASGSPPRPWVSAPPPTKPRGCTPCSGSSSASPSPPFRPSSGRLPTWSCGWRRPAC